MSDERTVSTRGGLVEGRRGEDGIHVFEGVPYAAPPVGALRFRPPAPVEPWDGVRSATRPGAVAHQNATQIAKFFGLLVSEQGFSWWTRTFLRTLVGLAPRPKESEDCLYLNVRTPSLDPNAKLPVMVWIHGGDHQDGSGTDPLFRSNALPSREVCLVTINYRLWVYGYLSHPALSAESPDGVSGNYGTLDQIAALRWVQENIRAFGGDPDNVTVFGESAGGESVAHMMTSPLARGLFHRAALQSPANAGQLHSLDSSYLRHRSGHDRGEDIVEALVGGSSLDALRAVPAATLSKKVRAMGFDGLCYPVIDGHVLPKSPFAAFRDGDQARVPMLLGSNADEGTLIEPLLGTCLPLVSPEDLEETGLGGVLAREFGGDADSLQELYPGLSSGRDKARRALLGDAFFGHKAHLYARYAAGHGQSVHLYFFEQTPPSPTQRSGAFHAGELPYVHGVDNPVLPVGREGKPLREAMGDYWTAFATHGEPRVPGRPRWPRYRVEEPAWMRLGPDLGGAPVSRLDRYAILDRRFERLLEGLHPSASKAAE